jgi:hypothetical protein
MCPELEINKRRTDDETKPKAVEPVHSHLYCTNEVLLQTLCCTIQNGENQKVVRILLDPGSQKSYILEKTARKLGAKPDGEVELRHLLFGGHTDALQHKSYNLVLEGCSRSATVKLLGESKICERVPRMPKGLWISELKQKKFFVSDIGENAGEIEVLIGADYYAAWLTGRKQSLSNGLVALETRLSWTLSGKLEITAEDSRSDVAMLAVSMFVTEAKVSDLRNLDTIGINDPVEHKSREQGECEVKRQFLQTATRCSDGRYSVSLPWIDAWAAIPWGSRSPDPPTFC